MYERAVAVLDQETGNPSEATK